MNIKQTIVTVLVCSLIVMGINSGTKISKSQSVGKQNLVGIIKEPLKNGNFEGIGKGYNGDIKVNITINSGKMEDIEIIDSNDDEEYLLQMDGLIKAILENESIDVDTISGATFSSNGVIDAVKDALMKAGGLK
ncbi:MAG: FMN-binding protein [Peptoniphilus sp.]|uniref:FMN-binding protein n=1 Tax=Peptoniphilus sp. TaxID=1971214 RepID=UPI002A759345|nr:FMN-binding protein [Peptoniphilus sp.]MDY2986624.1 FMN-binding protein [Peptoniphilus sp.]